MWRDENTLQREIDCINSTTFLSQHDLKWLSLPMWNWENLHSVAVKRYILLKVCVCVCKCFSLQKIMFMHEIQRRLVLRNVLYLQLQWLPMSSLDHQNIYAVILPVPYSQPVCQNMSGRAFCHGFYLCDINKR